MLDFEQNRGSEGYKGEISPEILLQSPIFRERIDKIVSLESTYPNRSLEQQQDSFEDNYLALGPTQDGSIEGFKLKWAIGAALLEDGRYRNVRFISENFVPKGVEASEEVQKLNEDIQLRARQRLLSRGDPRETARAAEELSEFASNVAEGLTLDGQDFRKLVGIFGSSRVVDVLYRTRPEFQGLPHEQVQGILADYLGNFLVATGGFNFGDVGRAVPYLSDPNLAEGLYEVVKDSCSAFYRYSKKMNQEAVDQEIIDEYFEILGLEADVFSDDRLKAIFQRVQDYYVSVESDYPKPDSLVEYLREGRDFPDRDQRIAIKELDDKKRVVNAASMRSGKSAPYIVGWETIKIRDEIKSKQAVIVAPADVIPNWVNYLSDSNEVVNGRRVGYFKPGQAPTILVVNGPESLLRPDLSSFDYVIVSHQRLNDNYGEQLSNLDFGMLIVDEVHKFKDLVDGVWSSNLLRLASRIEQDDSYMALLSGTPVPDRVKDVATILKLIYPQRFRSVDNRTLVSNIVKGDVVDLRSLLMPRMQMAALGESTQVRDLTEEVSWFELSKEEKAVYDVLMEEDELDPKDKIRILRQFILNPAMLDITPGFDGTKIDVVNQYLQQQFADHDKGVLFVNHYMEGVLRGHDRIVDHFELPDDVDLRLIMGGVSQEERLAIQRDLNSTDRRMLICVNGQTSDVGNDFSGVDFIAHYNQSWSQYYEDQQTARGLGDNGRPPLVSTTFVARDTVEEGINLHLAAKRRPIEKLLRGIPITELEQAMVQRDDQDQPDLSVNPELARYYFSAWDRMLKFFGYVKRDGGIGEERFKQFLQDYGGEYAQFYRDLGRRSYQANACRVSGAIIEQIASIDALDPRAIKILDVASGPEMLRRHIAEEYQDGIISTDINQSHFTGDGGDRVVGSFLTLPIRAGSMDIINLSLALQYAKFIPTRRQYERLGVLTEFNSALRMGGKLVINLIYNLDIKDFEKFSQIAQATGFSVMGELSGEIIEGQRYRSRIITLEKIADLYESGRTRGSEPDREILDGILENLTHEDMNGLKWVPGARSLSDSRRIVNEFTLGERTIGIKLNSEDLEILAEEKEVIKDGEDLKKRYDGVGKIPASDIIQGGFVRVLLGDNNRYVLFKRLRRGEGAVVIR